MEKVCTASSGSIVREKADIYTQIFWVVLFAVLTTFGSQIEIPARPVPFTLQTFFVLLCGAKLGARKGVISQLLYLSAGAAGLPVFSGWGFGISRLLGPAGGYLLGFPFAALITGYLIGEYKNFAWILFSMFIGLVAIFSFGIVFLNFFYIHNWAESVKGGMLVFSWWDGLKLFAAAGIYYQLSGKHRRTGG